MIDEKKLIEEIKKRRDYWESKAAEYDEAGERYEYLMDVCDGKATELTAALSIINEQPKVGEWIPCSERLPEDDIDVLATVDGGRYIAVYIFHIKDGEWIDFDGFVVDAAKVTAWQPLPEPWEEEKNDGRS